MTVPRRPGTPPGWQPNRRFRHVFAIVRADGAVRPDVPIENQITIVRVMSDSHFAYREAARLNAVNADKKVRYFVQMTRLDLRSVPPDDSEGGE